MKKDLTEIVFILDRSGSMSGLEKDTIGGFNSLIEKQKKETGEAIITTILFDDKYEILHDRINLKGIKKMTDKDYYVRGSTALLDAMGKSINKTLNAYKNTIHTERPEKVLFVITTDGEENASTEFTYAKIKKRIETVKQRHKFEFLFLGANIDAEHEAGKFGIDRKNAVTYIADDDGTEAIYEAMDCGISSFRGSQKVQSNWKDSVEKDLKRRQDLVDLGQD